MFVKKKKERTPSKFYIWLFVVVLVLGGVLYLYQRWQPALPEDPQEALAQVSKNLQRSDTVFMKIKHNVGEDLESPSFVVAGEVEVSLPGNYIGTAEISGDPTFLEQSPVPQNFGFAYIDDIHYLKDGETWKDFSDVSEYTPFLRVEPVSFLDYARDNAEVARENDQEVDGQNYAVFTFSFPRDKASEVIKPLALLLSDVPPEASISARIWVDLQTRQLAKLTAEVSLPEVGGERLEVTYYNYNDPVSVYIMEETEKQAPPTEEEITVKEEETSRQERNERRQIDMLAIRAALEKIYEANNTYPEAPKRVNLSNQETDIQEQLLVYLKEIPVDPQTSEYYYGYQCEGGEQFELTGIQETEQGIKVIKLTQSSHGFEE
ncbi:hypothetical protein ACFL0Z_02690 [Patescibacteria group bacterium]